MQLQCRYGWTFNPLSRCKEVFALRCGDQKMVRQEPRFLLLILHQADIMLGIHFRPFPAFPETLPENRRYFNRLGLNIDFSYYPNLNGSLK